MPVARIGVAPIAIGVSQSRASTDRRSLASDHRHVLRRIAFALDLYPRGCLRDGAHIAWRQLNLGGADILFEPMELRRARNRDNRGTLGKEPRARDLSRSLALLVADPLQQIHERVVFLH